MFLISQTKKTYLSNISCSNTIGCATIHVDENKGHLLQKVKLVQVMCHIDF